MPEPTTEAGRRAWSCIDMDYPNWMSEFGGLVEGIAAIEAEARAECEERNLRLQETVDFLSRDDTHVLSDEGLAYVQQEARADLARRIEARVVDSQCGWEVEHLAAIREEAE